MANGLWHHLVRFLDPNLNFYGFRNLFFAKDDFHLVGQVLRSQVSQTLSLFKMGFNAPVFFPLKVIVKFASDLLVTQQRAIENLYF